MSVQIRCQCGKRYRVADDARGKRLRCKDCGAELVIPRHSPVPPDDEFDLAQIDSQEGSAGDDDDDGRLPPRAGGFRRTIQDDDSSSEGLFAIGDIVIRSLGLFVFLVTLGNCAYQLLRANPVPGQDPTIDVFTWGIIPLVVAGPIALYIAWIGEEPDPNTRRANRVGGLMKCGVGVALIAVGGILTIVMTVFLAKFAGFGIAFTGLMFGGVMMIAYGGLSVLTGREFTKAGLTRNSSGTARKTKRPGWDSPDTSDDQRNASDRLEAEGDTYGLQSDRRVRSGGRSKQGSKRRANAGHFPELIALMVVAGAVCVVAVLAVIFWPAAKQDAKPDVADANRAKAAPKFVPPALPAGPAAPVFPPAIKFPPVQQPAPEVAGGPPATAPTDPPSSPPGGPGMRRGGFRRGGPVGPNRFRGGMPPTVPGFPATPGAPATAGPPAVPGFPAIPGRPTNPITLTPRIGGTNAAFSNSETSDKPLLGLCFDLGEWNGAQSISYLKPIFDRAASSSRGVEVVARERYVVGGLEVDADTLVSALRIVFMRIGDDGKIVAGDTYNSAWIGKPTGRTVRTIDGGDKVICGLEVGMPSQDDEVIINVGLALK